MVCVQGTLMNHLLFKLFQISKFAFPNTMCSNLELLNLKIFKVL